MPPPFKIDEKMGIKLVREAAKRSTASWIGDADLKVQILNPAASHLAEDPPSPHPHRPMTVKDHGDNVDQVLTLVRSVLNSPYQRIRYPTP